MHAQVHDEPSLRARQAIDDWLSGDRSRGTHGDLCAELRATLGIDLSNQEIDEIFRHAQDRDWAAEAIVVQLLGRDAGDRGPFRRTAKPR